MGGLIAHRSGVHVFIVILIRKAWQTCIVMACVLTLLWCPPLFGSSTAAGLGLLLFQYVSQWDNCDPSCVLFLTKDKQMPLSPTRIQYFDVQYHQL